MEIFNSIEQVIILYAPTLLMYLTQFVDWFVTLRKFKALNIQSQIAPVLTKMTDTAEKIAKLEKDIKTFSAERLSLAESVKDLQETIKAKDKEASEMREYLKNLSRENIELKAELRRKFECVAIEQKTV